MWPQRLEDSVGSASSFYVSSGTNKKLSPSIRKDSILNKLSNSQLIYTPLVLT
jgi:hypothetical protein